VTYTIVASNAGPLAISGATVADINPTMGSMRWTCVASAGSACNASGSGHFNETVTLAAGGMVTFTLTGDLTPETNDGELANTATITAPNGTDPNPGNNSATDVDRIVGVADLSVTKATAQTEYEVGRTITYTITVANAGPSNARNLELTDALPAGTTFSALEVPPGFTCTTPAAGANGTVTCSAPALGVGSTRTFTLTVRVDGNAEGDIANTASVSAESIDPTAANDASTSTLAAAMAQVPTLTEGVLLLLAVLLAAVAMKRM